MVTRFRNHLYNIRWKSSVEFDLPTLVIGNLIAGGSGKTPHVQYVISQLLGNKKVGILSRGYGRKTKGYLEVQQTSTAEEVGDEPLQYKNRFKEEALVAVGEERILAIPEMLGENIEGVVLDDAFQHRKLRAKAYVLLTEYRRPFYKDFVLPAGLLRESRKGASRADFIIVTKCPTSNIAFEEIENSIRKYNKTAPIAFSTYEYDELVLVNGEKQNQVMVFSGIAKANLFEDYVAGKYKTLGKKRFSDHHAYKTQELEELVKEAQQQNAMLVTTEKDYMRILNNPALEQIIQKVSFGYISIQVRFVSGEENFNDFIQKVFHA